MSLTGGGRGASEGHGLIRPSGTRGPLRHLSLYLVLADYSGVDPILRDHEGVRLDMIDSILSSVGKVDLLLGLNILARVWKRDEELTRVLQLLRASLSERSRTLLENALRPGPEQRTLVVRQGILEGFREVLRHGRDVPTTKNPEAAALMLTHSVLQRTHRSGQPIQFGGIDADLSIPICINQYFYGTDDDVSRFDRILRLWRDFGPKQSALLGGRTPGELLLLATGLDVEDLITMAFALWANHEQWSLGGPLYIDVNLHPGMDVERWTTFLDLVAATPEEFERSLTDPRSEWDFLEFENHPVIRMENGLLIMDSQLLLDRVTNGLYYFVLDHERARGETEREAWQKAWGRMIEELAESCLRPMAPLDFAGGRTFFTEEDLQIAYPNTKQSDVVLDFGAEVAVFEIVSGQLKIGSRVLLDVVSFREDFKKIVSTKLLQLDVTSSNILSNPAPLTGVSQTPTRVQPVLIAGGRFPVNFITMFELERFITDNELFTDARILPVAVMDLGEIEILEALCEQGQSPINLIARWRASEDAQVSFRNWIHNEPGLEAARPTRMNDQVESFMREANARLNLFDDSTARDADGEAD